MRPLVCPRCQRSNPAEAVFCHFDGAELRPAVGHADPLRSLRLASPFVFPSGRSCGTYEELARACQDDWETACGLLREGIFRQYLASIGRMDLARAAEEAALETDRDLALDSLLGRLPGVTRQGPRLDLKPRRWVLGTLRSGDTCDLLLTVLNQGRGLLHGTVRVDPGTPWLRVGEGPGNGECRLKTADQQAVVVELDTRGLPAPHTYSTKLTVITNGGAAEVPVRLDLAVQPFALGPFKGAASPREMAERMRQQPKPAVPLLESGEVARWFQANGWQYPVQGPAARGVAAVQQFFEGMGLSKPPGVQLSQTTLAVRSRGRETQRCEVQLQTTAKKWVYAHVASDAAWLRVVTPDVSGPQQATISLELDGAALPAGSVQEATVRVAANAGQELTLHVSVLVEQAAAVSPRQGLRPLLTGLLTGFLVRLTLALPGDFYARVLTGSFAAEWGRAAVAEPGFVKHFVLTTWWVGALVGFLLARRQQSRRTDPLWGLCAGAGAGLAGAATLACLLPVLDSVPRLVWRTVVPAGMPAWLGTGLGVALAAAWWAIAGALGTWVLAHGTTSGKRLAGELQKGLAKLCRRCGLQGLAGRLAEASPPP